MTIWPGCPGVSPRRGCPGVPITVSTCGFEIELLHILGAWRHHPNLLSQFLTLSHSIRFICPPPHYFMIQPLPKHFCPVGSIAKDGWAQVYPCFLSTPVQLVLPGSHLLSQLYLLGCLDPNLSPYKGNLPSSWGFITPILSLFFLALIINLKHVFNQFNSSAVFEANHNLENSRHRTFKYLSCPTDL